MFSDVLLEDIAKILRQWAKFRDRLLEESAKRGQGGDETAQNDETYAETPKAVTGDSERSDGKAMISAAFVTKCPKCGKRAAFDVHFEELPRFVRFLVDFENRRVRADASRFSANYMELTIEPAAYFCGECVTQLSREEFNPAFAWEPNEAEPPEGVEPKREGAEPPEGVLSYETQGESEAATEAVVPSMPSEKAKAFNAWRTKCPYCEEKNFETGDKRSIRTIDSDKFITVPEHFLTCFSCGGIYEVEDRSKELINHAEVFDSVESLQVAFEDALWQFLTEPFLASTNIRKESNAYQSAVRNVCKRILEAYEGKIELDLNG